MKKNKCIYKDLSIEEFTHEMHDNNMICWTTYHEGHFKTEKRFLCCYWKEGSNVNKAFNNFVSWIRRNYWFKDYWFVFNFVNGNLYTIPQGDLVVLVHYHLVQYHDR